MSNGKTTKTEETSPVTLPVSKSGPASATEHRPPWALIVLAGMAAASVLLTVGPLLLQSGDEVFKRNVTYILLAFGLSALSALGLGAAATVHWDIPWERKLNISLAGAGVVWIVVVVMFYSSGLIVSQEGVGARLIRYLENQQEQSGWMRFKTFQSKLVQTGHDRVWVDDPDTPLRQMLDAAYLSPDKRRLRNVTIEYLLVYLPPTAQGNAISLRRITGERAAEEAAVYQRTEASLPTGGKSSFSFARVRPKEVERVQKAPAWWTPVSGVRADIMVLSLFAGDTPKYGDSLNLDLPKYIDREDREGAKLRLAVITNETARDFRFWEVQPAVLTVAPEMPLLFRTTSISETNTIGKDFNTDLGQWMKDLDALFEKEVPSRSDPQMGKTHPPSIAPKAKPKETGKNQVKMPTPAGKHVESSEERDNREFHKFIGSLRSALRDAGMKEPTLKDLLKRSKPGNTHYFVANKQRTPLLCTFLWK